ncbi:Histidine kinase 1 [Acorus gramineus]|uniref:Histidine kinase 1 n=1 Tax=Acorus gramineus TaxID=55184 RepID=A0AAV9A6L3_ACOGR|nr:Histidine kinase 1 [Acorus gramineus]
MGASISKKNKEATSTGTGDALSVEANSPTLKGSEGQGSDDFATKNKMLALVVDDNCVIRRIHKMLLTKLGVDSLDVENGKQAVDLFLAGGKFDIVLMDREMPVMNGIEATKILRSMGMKTKIVGVSANSEKKDIKEFMDAGIDEFLPKPIDRAKLAAIIDNIDESVV